MDADDLTTSAEHGAGRRLSRRRVLRQGIGEALLQPVFAAADRDGLSCYLEAPTEENSTVVEYQRVVAKTVQPVEKASGGRRRSHLQDRLASRSAGCSPWVFETGSLNPFQNWITADDRGPLFSPPAVGCREPNRRNMRSLACAGGAT